MYELALFNQRTGWSSSQPSLGYIFMRLPSPHEKNHRKQIILGAALRKAERGAQHGKLSSLQHSEHFCQRDSPDPNCSCHHSSTKARLSVGRGWGRCPVLIPRGNIPPTHTDFLHLNRPKVKCVFSKTALMLSEQHNATSKQEHEVMLEEGSWARTWASCLSAEQTLPEQRGEAAKLPEGKKWIGQRLYLPMWGFLHF